MGKTKRRKKTKAKQPIIEKRVLYNYRILFVVLISIFTLIFLKKLISSAGFEYNGGLQILIYVGLISIFSWLCWESFSKELSKKRLLIVSLVGFILILTIYILAFDPVLDPGGDNAAYIIHAKSLAAFQGFKSLSKPGSPPTTDLPPALPFLLAPIVRFFGINVVAFKMIPFCMAILFVILISLFFRNYLSLPITLIIALLIATNTQIIHFSSLILTEVPFLFFSLLSLFLLDRFEKENQVMGKYLFLSGFFIVVTYWTRHVALGFIGTSVLYFILKRDYKKAFALAVIVLIFFLPWQIRCKCVQPPGVRSAFDFLHSKPGESSFVERTIGSGITNLKIAANVIPQNIFNYKIVEGKVLKTNLWIVLVLILTIIGYVWHIIRRRSQMDLYTPVVALAPLILSASVPLIISRYFIVLIPFLIYYFFKGLSLTLNQLRGFKIPKNVSHTILLTVMSLMFFVNLLGVSDRIRHSHRSEPHSPAYARFLETAYWAKDNTPKDAYFAARKARTFFIFSDRHASGYFGEGVGRYDSWSEEAEREILEMYKEKDIDYLILDHFSSSAYRLIYPIIRNNPSKFDVVYVTQKPETYVLKLNKWW